MNNKLINPANVLVVFLMLAITIITASHHHKNAMSYGSAIHFSSLNFFNLDRVKDATVSNSGASHQEANVYHYGIANGGQEITNLAHSDYPASSSVH